MTRSELPLLARHLDGRTSVLLTGARIVLAGGRRTDAVLIAGDRILAVGPDARAAASALAPPAVELALPELPPVTVLPGFIDAHTHLVHQGLELARLDLGPAASSHEAIERVRAALAEHDPGRPFIAEGFDDSSWPAGGRLERAMLDRLAPRTPVILRRVCGHLAVANGAALAALAALPAGASYAERGLIAAESGVLLEDAAMRLRSLFPPTAVELDQAVARAEAMALRLGITSAHDIEDAAGIAALARRRRASALALRITVHAAEEQLAGLEALGIGSGPGDPWLKLGGVKLFLDGSIGARTAALRVPFADRQDRGRLLFDTSELMALVRRIDAAGSTAVLHAIGDAAIDQALTALEAIGPQAVRAARHRIEHLELTPDDLVDRLAQVGATASMQPNFVDRWGGRGGLYEQALGPERVRRMNRFRTLLERGIPLAFGSDCMPIGPLSGLRGAISHPVPEERLSLAEALAAYSAGGALAGFSEPETGTIAPGRWADLVLVAGDLFASADPAASQVLATIVGGHLRYTAPSG